MLPSKNIVEPLAQPPHGFASSKARDGPGAAIPQRSQFIDAVAMVGMIVRPEHRVDPVDRIGEQLLAQVGRGIDQQPVAGLALDQDRHTGAAIFGLGRVAFAPIIADPRHPGRRSRTEHQQLHSPALVNKRLKLRVVTAARCSGVTPRKAATNRAVSAT